MFRFISVNTIDIPIDEFIEIDGFKEKLPTGNTLNINFNIRKTIKTFEKKVIDSVKENPAYQEVIKEIIIYKLKDDKERILGKLRIISQLKLDELNSIIMLEQFIRPPETKIEKISFQTFIDNAIKEVFGDKAEEEISNLLVSSWLREKELTYVNILDEI